MNVGPGGKQPVMYDTVWNGQVQKLVDEDGVPKGMRKILQEREVDTTGMRAKDVRVVLKTHPDYNAQKTTLEEYIEERGHICLFYPKFHCELALLNASGVKQRNIIELMLMELSHDYVRLY